ncbi:hypothetical protein [Cumulibacter soli]|uniref:hypothetical protein n=1 Tax=Cumulibacter soli TaxID=2546344 RepID=UPI001067B9B7|nr:hypothetical protein [Cumulibacter soli]
MTSHKVYSILLLGGIAVLLAFWGDPIALQLVAYIPILIAGWIGGADDVPTVGQILGDWHLWRSVIVLVAVVLLFQLARRLWPTRRPLEQLSRSTLQRLLTTAVVLAVIPPLLYAVTRLAWVFGWPLGLSPEFFEEVRSILGNGLVLGLLAVAGAILTVGLLRGWGEVFPRWIPFMGGKDVPIGFARRFALIVALLIASAGPFFVRAKLAGGQIAIAPEGAENHWGAWLPEMLWPLWAIALVVAAFAYEERRLRSATRLEELRRTPVAG